MDSLLTQIRNHYVDQFRNFVDLQAAQCPQGASEVILEIGDNSELYDGLYRADFITKSGDGVTVVDLNPENVLAFDPFEISHGKADIILEQLWWHDVVLHHDADALVSQSLSAWFGEWFDPDDGRYDEKCDFGLVIHALSIQPGRISVDFGTAETDAFWSLLRLVVSAGAQQLRVSNST